MFRKPKNRNIRQRIRQDTDDDDESPVKIENKDEEVKKDDEIIVDDNSSVGVTINQRKPIQLVSFDQDEDNDIEEFKIKKPSHRKRAEKLLKKQREYEKKQKEFEEAKKYDVEKALGLVIKNPITGKSVDEDDEYEKPNERIEDDDVIIEAVKETMESTSSMLGVDGIPDAKTVYEMKKKRERMRKTQNNDDSYIPLTTSTTTTTIKDKVVHSRLIREDENDYSDEDDTGPTTQFYSSKSLLVTDEERRRKEQEELMMMNDTDEDEDNDDEETKRRAKESDEEFAEWEKHQIKKAVSSKHVKQMKSENIAMERMEPDVITLDEGEDMDIEIDSKTAEDITKKIPNLSNLKLTDITDKLKMRIEDKTNNIAFQEHDLIRKKDTIEENEKMIKGIEEDYPKLREKFRLYQEIKIYTKDLLDCINDKMDVIVDLESKILNMWKNRSEKLIKRRRQDVTDEYNRCLALSKNKQYQPSNELQQREINREARRSYRRIQREKANIQYIHNEGMSSDEDEPESQLYEYQKTMQECIEISTKLFDDATEEFYDIFLIMDKYCDWLLLEQKTFEDAYIGLCLPKLLSPFIRLELLNWNPLKDISKPIFEFNWYKKLLKVGTNKVGFDLEHSVIVNLIPDIIDKLLFPRLTKIITEQWDPYSLSQSRNLSYIINLLINESPTLTSESKNVKNLLKAILDKLKSSVNEDSDIPVFGKEALENSSTGCELFFNRRYWSIIKLIKSTNCFNEILSKKYLQEIIIDGYINRCIVLMLHFLKDFSTTTDKCLAIIGEIPNEWISNKNSEKFGSLIIALKRVIDANPGSTNSRKISKFISKIEN